MRLTLLIVLLEVLSIVAGYGGKMYNRWRTPMAKYGFKWTAVPAKTQDGYNLLIFRITGNKNGEYKKNRTPVLMVPGLFDDAARWLEMQSYGDEAGEELPLMLQIAEAGYDVWIGNIRGTEYASDHKLFSSYSPEYWNFNWDKDHARMDVPTMVRRVKEMTGMRKIFYIGYSQGAGSMITALTDKNLHYDVENSLHKFIALSPCVRFRTDGLDEAYFEQGLYQFMKNDIHSLFGPTWNDDLTKICKTFSQQVCDEYTALGMVSEDAPVAPQATSVQNLVHWWNTSFRQRYQRYSPNYTRGQKETEEMDVSSISHIRIAVFAPENDEMCVSEALDGMKTDYMQRIPGISHVHFDTAKDKQLVDDIIAQLKIAPGDEEPNDEL